MTQTDTNERQILYEKNVIKRRKSVLSNKVVKTNYDI